MKPIIQSVLIPFALAAFLVACAPARATAQTGSGPNAASGDSGEKTSTAAATDADLPARLTRLGFHVFPEPVELPAFTAEALDPAGQALTLDSFKGTVTLLNFWATWCPPCRQEIPGLLAFADEIGPERLKLVLVAVADERDRAVAFVGNPRYPVLFDPVWDVARRFRTVQLPETHLVLDGKLAATFIGASDWRSSLARTTVLARLDERAAKRAAAKP